MQVIVELVAAVVVWLAVTTLNQFGVEVDLAHPEPKVERVIQRESAPARKALVTETPCPDEAVPADHSHSGTA